MKFGEVPINKAHGGILAHSLRTSSGKVKKGRILSEQDIANLVSAGYTTLTIARLETDDASENEAAEEIAKLLGGTGIQAGQPITGRVSLCAQVDGLLVVDPLPINALNALNESITLCTLAPWTRVVSNQQVAAIKIIPFGINRKLLHAARETLGDATAVRVAPFKSRKVGLIQTTLPGMPNNLLEKMVKITCERLIGLSCVLNHELRCEHEPMAVARGIDALLARECELICILGASAVVDRRDIVPSGIEAAGGKIQHFGIPVDPGNLILIARCNAVPILALPGSVRSPRQSGFDEILRRIIADTPPSSLDIASMGVGGLLK